MRRIILFLSVVLLTTACQNEELVLEDKDITFDDRTIVPND